MIICARRQPFGCHFDYSEKRAAAHPFGCAAARCRLLCGNTSIDILLNLLYYLFTKETGFVPGIAYGWRGLPVSFLMSIMSYRYFLSSLAWRIISDT